MTTNRRAKTLAHILKAYFAHELHSNATILHVRQARKANTKISNNACEKLVKIRMHTNEQKDVIKILMSENYLKLVFEDGQGIWQWTSHTNVLLKQFNPVLTENRQISHFFQV